MRLELTGRHVTITPTVRKLVERQIASLLRVLNDAAVSAQVVLTRQKGLDHVELTLHARGEHFLHANATGASIGAALGSAVDKVSRQAEKVKGKWQARKRRARKNADATDAAAVAADRAETTTQEVRVIRARRYQVRPLSLEEASRQVGNYTDAFVVFRNTGTDTISVLFRRPDGNLGLIDPDA